MQRRLKAVLIDLSGTIHIEDSQIPGSVEALQRLRGADLKVRFVTNTTKESLSALHGRLSRLGFAIGRGEIFTSLSAARRLVDRRRLRPLLLLQQEALEDFEGVDVSDPNAVLVGLAPDHFNYESLTRAFRLVMDGAELIAVHKARYLRRTDGLALGPGPFVAGLEYATGRSAQVVGKPEPAFFRAALDGLHCQPDEAVMIGDDACDDVGGALAAGLQGVLVRTGKYRAGDEALLPPSAHTVDSFPAAVQLVLERLRHPPAGPQLL